MKYQSTKGQTIVEAIVAVTVVVLLVTGLIAGTTSSLKSVQSGRTREQATKLADDALEYARSLRNESWTSFLALGSSSGIVHCYGSDDVLPNVAPGSGCVPNFTTANGVFTRTVTFTWDSVGEKMTVLAKVEYPAGDSKTNVSLTTYLTRWK